MLDHHKADVSDLRHSVMRHPFFHQGTAHCQPPIPNLKNLNVIHHRGLPEGNFTALCILAWIATIPRIFSKAFSSFAKPSPSLPTDLSVPSLAPGHAHLFLFMCLLSLNTSCKWIISLVSFEMTFFKNSCFQSSSVL